MKKISGITLLKLIVALQIFYAHMLSNLGLEGFSFGNHEVLNRLLPPFLGVPVFFVLSGYFIWKMLSTRDISVKEYAARRFARIYPEL